VRPALHARSRVRTTSYRRSAIARCILRALHVGNRALDCGYRLQSDTADAASICLAGGGDAAVVDRTKATLDDEELGHRLLFRQTPPVHSEPIRLAAPAGGVARNSSRSAQQAACAVECETKMRAITAPPHPRARTHTYPRTRTHARTHARTHRLLRATVKGGQRTKTHESLVPLKPRPT
jgi:hypothetical protein